MTVKSPQTKNKNNDNIDNPSLNSFLSGFIPRSASKDMKEVEEKPCGQSIAFIFIYTPDDMSKKKTAEKRKQQEDKGKSQ